MDPRLILIYVPTEAGTTHFQLQFSRDRGGTWAGFDPVTANPASAADVAVGDLDADSNYLLDGVNSPAGNKLDASRAGNRYRLRLKNVSGYGNWSDSFMVGEEPDDDGPLCDPLDVLDEAGLRRESVALTEAELGSLLARLCTDAMDAHRLDTRIDALYTGTRTAALERLLARAERLHAAAMLLRRPELLRVLGDHPPLLMEDSEEIAAAAERLMAQARALLTAVAEGATDAAYAGVRMSFTADDARTFTRGMDW